MISFILGTAVFFILMYLALIFESTALALLGFSVAAIVVLSFFYIHAVRRALAVRISITISIAEKNRPFNMTLRFRNDLTGVMIDRFGTGIMIIPDGDEHARTTITISVSRQFFGWVTGIGSGIEIVSPKEVREEYKEYLKGILQNY